MVRGRGSLRASSVGDRWRVSSAGAASADSAGPANMNDMSRPSAGSGDACALTLCGTCN